MGLFDFLKRRPPAGPYADPSINRLYELLFCDNLDLYRTGGEQPRAYPFDVLLAAAPPLAQLEQLLVDPRTEPRVALLAYRRQQALGHPVARQELLAIIVEVGLEDGLDVLASFRDGTARYFNQAGKLLIWETTTDATANELTNRLFASGREVVARIGPWTEPRRPHPARGVTRLTLLVSDGLYFGEGPTDVLFADPLAAATLGTATQLLRYLTETALARQDAQAP
ncbi:hypothetical protein HHL22_03125 [Hymenobacter sp. RP-2-7]|uniref:Uncharacterized protein n=1 Tax=Hymenobacter polaris TaxID=2682546 RepID=A0A7Y0ABC0_9BACT|nr:hypothetical protein [Hymenobacter polaris]NML64189.1 hypothetical protein [Hymenobacter polaris]